MADDGVRIKARIRLLPSEESGRTAPIAASYRPNHNFSGPDNRVFVIGAIDLPVGALLHPGESIDLEMTLYPWPLDVDLSPGREWRIQEGGQLMGIGTVLDVLKPPNSN